MSLHWEDEFSLGRAKKEKKRKRKEKTKNRGQRRCVRAVTVTLVNRWSELRRSARATFGGRKKRRSRVAGLVNNVPAGCARFRSDCFGEFLRRFDKRGRERIGCGAGHEDQARSLAAFCQPGFFAVFERKRKGRTERPRFARCRRHRAVCFRYHSRRYTFAVIVDWRTENGFYSVG